MRLPFIHITVIHNIASSQRGASTRRKRGSTTRKRSSKKTVSYLRMAGTFVITALFIVSLFALYRIEPEQTSQPAVVVENTAAKPDKLAIPQTEAKDEYSFYSKLKDFEVKIPASSNYDSQRSSDDNFVYLIQAGSFKTPQQAERRLVELKLLGLEPKVSSARNDSDNLWHRVRLGPFSSRSHMAAARATLIANDIEAMVMKRGY